MSSPVLSEDAGTRVDNSSICCPVGVRGFSGRSLLSISRWKWGSFKRTGSVAPFVDGKPSAVRFVRLERSVSDSDGTPVADEPEEVSVFVLLVLLGVSCGVEFTMIGVGCWRCGLLVNCVEGTTTAPVALFVALRGGWRGWYAFRPGSVSLLSMLSSSSW